MKDRLLKMIKAKEDKKATLGKRAKETNDISELRNINEDIETINTDILELRAAINEIDDKEEREDIASMPLGKDEDNEEPERRSDAEKQIVGSYITGTGDQGLEERAKLKEKYEQRGKALKDGKVVTFSIGELPEFRAVTVGGGTLVVPTHESTTLNTKFKEVSSLIDRVNAVPLPGGNSYKKGFEVSSGEGDYTLEEGDYADAEPAYDYVDIGKAKITAYAEISDEAVNLPNINYQSLVAKDIQVALRKKITKQILVGPGGTNALRGIFNAPINVIPTASDLEVAEINADTLDKIVFGYGGDEEIEGGAVLVLNKKDLAAFAAIRGNDGKKLYKITLDGNTGTLSSDGSFSIPFVINSAAPALSASGTAADTYCMAYGMVKAYEMPIFSDVDVQESKDYKFKQGIIAYRGSVWTGGNVAKYKGFVRVKKTVAV